MKSYKFTEFMQERGQALIYLVCTALVLFGIALSHLRGIFS